MLSFLRQIQSELCMLSENIPFFLSSWENNSLFTLLLLPQITHTCCTRQPPLTSQPVPEPSAGLYTHCSRPPSTPPIRSPWPRLLCWTRFLVWRLKCIMLLPCPLLSCRPARILLMERLWVWRPWALDLKTTTGTPCPESPVTASASHWAHWEVVSPSLIQVVYFIRFFLLKSTKAGTTWRFETKSLL